MSYFVNEQLDFLKVVVSRIHTYKKLSGLCINTPEDYEK